MKKIMLVCCAGMSTSLLVTKMNLAAVKQKINVKIFAIGESEIKKYENVDAVLLGPQVRFLLKNVKKIMDPKGIPVAVIDSINYGKMDGEAVLRQALELVEE